MSTLAKAIKFRLLSDKLTDNEFNHFISKITSIYGRNVILSPMFNQFIQPNTSILAKAPDYIDDIIQIASEIINSRPKSIHTNYDYQHNVSTNACLIRHIASYLPQKEYIHFCEVNRCTFVACNMPNSLQILDLTNVCDYNNVRLETYSSIKNLKLNVSQFKNIQLPSDKHNVFENLKYLTLNCEKHSNIDMTSILKAKQCICFNNIEQLSLINFGDRDCGCDALKIWRLLSNFKNIKFLRLTHVYYDQKAIINTNQLLTVFTKLKGLSLFGVCQDMFYKFINIFGDKLNVLGMIQFTPILNINSIDFSKLKELRLITPSIQTIGYIFKSCKHLEKCWITPQIGNLTFINSKQTMDIFEKLIIEENNLKSIVIDCNALNIDAITSGIECGLFKTKMFKRHMMKIRFGIDCNCKMKEDIFMLHISRIIHVLQSSNINDYMLIWNCYGKYKFNKIKLSKNIRDFVESSKPKVSEIGNHYNVAITNKKCKINGFSECWSMCL